MHLPIQLVREQQDHRELFILEYWDLDDATWVRVKRDTIAKLANRLKNAKWNYDWQQNYGLEPSGYDNTTLRVYADHDRTIRWQGYLADYYTLSHKRLSVHNSQALEAHPVLLNEEWNFQAEIV